MKKVTVQYNLPVNILREGKKFVAFSSVLDLSTSGDSFEEVNQRFIEIAEIFLKKLSVKVPWTRFWQVRHVS